MDSEALLDTQKSIEKKNFQTKCHICIGCGRCLEENKEIHILTKQPVITQKNNLQNPSEPIVYEKENLQNSQKKRLVTVDLGTTTVAMQLYGKNGSVQHEFVSVNPQIKYGADVLSRILAAENSEKAQDMKNLIYSVLKQGLDIFREALEKEESLYMVLAGNTAMIYLLMGWNPKELGYAPFRASHLDTVHTVIDGVICDIFAGFSAFVGGDIAAGMIACEFEKKEKLTLFIDLGTNGEIVLGNKNHVTACSTAAGPAFEGGANRGIWGADMVSLIDKLRQKEILDNTGLMADAYFEQGIFIGDVLITQKSVREIQLAKAAIMAGIQVLVKKREISFEEIDQVILAGGFGYYLKPEAAIRIGLLPKALEGKIIAGGNTALAGAFLIGKEMLFKENGNFKELTGCKIPIVEILNLAEQETFYKWYLQSMNLETIW